MKEVEVKQAGSYTVKAKNDQGQISASAKLKVNGKYM